MRANRDAGSVGVVRTVESMRAVQDTGLVVGMAAVIFPSPPGSAVAIYGGAAVGHGVRWRDVVPQHSVNRS